MVVSLSSLRCSAGDTEWEPSESEAERSAGSSQPGSILAPAPRHAQPTDQPSTALAVPPLLQVLLAVGRASYNYVTVTNQFLVKKSIDFNIVVRLFPVAALSIYFDPYETIVSVTY